MTQPYGAVVLDHFRRPRNQRSLENPSVSREGYNPLCGDRVRIELDVRAGTVAAATFAANACAICTAAASLLTERVAGIAVSAALMISDADVLASLEAEIPPARAQCATLPLRTLREALVELTPRA